MMLLDLDDRAAAIEAVHAATALFTVAPIVDSLLDRIGWPQQSGRLLDPCAGDGSFLVRALARLETPVNDLSSLDRLSGWELHPLARACARDSVAQVLVARGWTEAVADRGASMMIAEGDFLMQSHIAPGTFRFIAGNPPYLRYGHLPDYFKALFDSNVPESARGDMLHAFLLHCASILPENGVIAFVSADRWLFNSTASKLRESLGDLVGISHVARLDPETSFYRPKYRRKGTPPRIHPVEIVLTPHARNVRPIGQPPLSPDDGEPMTPATGKTLDSVASVRIAPWLGPNGIFVVAADKMLELGEGVTAIPAVDTDDIDSGTGQLAEPKRFALVTKKSEEPSGLLRDHLLSQRAILPKKCKNYWSPPEPINLDLDKPSFLIPRIAKHIRVIDLPAGVLPINHNLQVVSSDAMPAATLRRILTCQESQDWIARNAPRLENGYYSITTTLLRSMPLPSWAISD